MRADAVLESRNALESRNVLESRNALRTAADEKLSARSLVLHET